MPGSAPVSTREPAYTSPRVAGLSVSLTLACTAWGELSGSLAGSASVSFRGLTVSVSCALEDGAISFSLSVPLWTAGGVSLVLYLLPEPALALVLRIVRLPLVPAHHGGAADDGRRPTI